jgi:hypothetical protein
MIGLHPQSIKLAAHSTYKRNIVQTKLILNKCNCLFKIIWYLFQINNVDVTKASHEKAVELVKKTDEITLVVCSGSDGKC